MNIELNFPPKLRGARSRLYRRRFLQVNTRWKALAEIYTMHSFAPFSSLNFFVKLLRNFRHFFHNFCYFSVIFLDFFEILLKFCRNFWKFHGNPLNLQISMNFRGCRTKPRPKCVEKPSAARFARPLRGAEVLVAVRGPSPGEGGGKNKTQEESQRCVDVAITNRAGTLVEKSRRGPFEVPRIRPVVLREKK